MKPFIVAVGSKNPTKMKPVEDIFRIHFPDVCVVGVDVASGVSDQPKNDDEIYTGAKNRALNALHAVDGAAYGVGIEGGIANRPFGRFEYSLVVVVDRFGHEGIGSSGGLLLPDKIVGMIDEDKTLEEAIDETFGTEKIGRGIGMFGIMTKGVVTRAEGVKHGVAFALARFLHPDVYR